MALAKGYNEGTVAKETIEETRQSSRYQELVRQLQFIRENMDANDSYLAYLDGQELDDLDGNMENWNPNGGAIAFGHPNGASGARVCIFTMKELVRRGGRYGMFSSCCGGRLGVSTLIETI